MKILEKDIRISTGGGCEYSCIIVKQNNEVHFFAYENQLGYAYYKAPISLVNQLMKDEDADSYYDLLIYNEILEQLTHIESNGTDIIKDNKDDEIAEEFLFNKLSLNLTNGLYQELRKLKDKEYTIGEFEFELEDILDTDIEHGILDCITEPIEVNEVQEHLYADCIGGEDVIIIHIKYRFKSIYLYDVDESIIVLEDINIEHIND